MVRNVRTTDTSDFDFVVQPTTDTLAFRYSGSMQLILNYTTDSAFYVSQNVDMTWSIFGSTKGAFRIWPRMPPPQYPWFCDAGGNFKIHPYWIDLDVQAINLRWDPNCDSTIHLGGKYGSAVVGGTLTMHRVDPWLRTYMYFELRPN
jgi:hypothetical protein